MPLPILVVLLATTPSPPVERLGNPLLHLETPWARNVWDLQSYRGRLYVAHGDYHRNSGPFRVIAYDPELRRFVEEDVLPEEAVEAFHVFEGELWAAGLDSTESWDWGSLYLRNKEGWRRLKTIPNGVHVYSVARRQELLFVSHTTSDPDAPVRNLRSRDQGQTWKPVPTRPFGDPPLPIPEMVIRDFFEIDGQLCGGTQGQLGPRPIALCHDGEAYEIRPVNAFPGADGPHPIRWGRPASFHGSLVYVGLASVPFNGGAGVDFRPVGLFAARTLEEARPVTLPEDAVPYDLLVSKGRLLVLTAHEADGTHTIRVLSTPDLESWSEVVRFSAPTFARSFELLGGDLYFGLGGHEGDGGIGSAGGILRVRGSSLGR
jgi:hypothetical protein